ncbi:phytoene/squalene synthase family protein [Rubritalea marina]|uniref:phytoene/squalene synthase family protein n=1 Tax=Rubritalea marina TaxID=361055 RepID=UPI00037ABCF8|nr:squalene/phytoene synthase family protein [Rubritalea marina]
MSEALSITQNAKSNLAFAFLFMPKERRNDMVTFYAFCRVIDDLADEASIPLEERRAGLDSWIACFKGDAKPELPLQQDTLNLRDRYRIDNNLFLELIAGCESDLHPSRRFQNWEELEQYTYQVACCVGLISLSIFGCKHPKSDDYAIALGHALQFTNILRDIGEDLDDQGRIYLPIELMQKHGYTEEALQNREYNAAFSAMCQEIAQRAQQYYQKAIQVLPEEDAAALRPAEGMRKIYSAILSRADLDGFKVFDTRYTIPRWKKLVYLISSQF